MNDNKLDIRRLDKWRAESAEMFRVIGLRATQYEGLLGELADAGTEKIIAKASQFLFDFDEAGVPALIDRTGKCKATIYNRRTENLDIISKKATGS